MSIPKKLKKKKYKFYSVGPNGKHGYLSEDGLYKIQLINKMSGSFWAVIEVRRDIWLDTYGTLEVALQEVNGSIEQR